MGSLGSALIPVLVETRQKRGTEAEQKLLSSMMFLSMSALILIAAAAWFLCAILPAHSRLQLFRAEADAYPQDSLLSFALYGVQRAGHICVRRAQRL